MQGVIVNLSGLWDVRGEATVVFMIEMETINV